MSTIHLETHQSRNIGWLRAAVLGANDGLISTSSLVVGVAAAQPDRASVVVAALAGLVAGALSMAAGEYVSVSSQSDTEAADLAREQMELATQPEHELAELASIYVSRGLSPALATQVAVELTAHDALGAHARDELGIHDLTRARPVQAALASAAAFAVGAGLPVIGSRHSGIPEVVLDGENGLVVEERDVQGLASGLIHFSDEGNRLRAASNARRTAETRFCSTKQGDELLKLLESIA